MTWAQCPSVELARRSPDSCRYMGLFPVCPRTRICGHDDQHESVSQDDGGSNKTPGLTADREGVDGLRDNYKVARAGGDRDLVFDNIVRLMRYRDRLEVNRHQSSVTEPFDEFKDAFFHELQKSIASVESISRNPLLEAERMMKKIKLSNHVAQQRNHDVGMFMDSTAGKTGVLQDAVAPVTCLRHHRERIPLLRTLRRTQGIASWRQEHSFA